MNETLTSYSAKGPKDVKPGTPPKGPAGASSANQRRDEQRNDPDDS